MVSDHGTSGIYLSLSRRIQVLCLSGVLLLWNTNGVNGGADVSSGAPSGAALATSTDCVYSQAGRHTGYQDECALSESVGLWDTRKCELSSPSGINDLAEDSDDYWWDGFGTQGVNEKVEALLVYDRSLIAGGWFTRAGGQDAEHIALWNGSCWSPLGRGIGGTVHALAGYGSDLIAGGWFTTAGDDTVRNIARWDGTSWSSLGEGMSSRVVALAVYDGDLIAGGFFIRAGQDTVKHIARWDGSSWSPLGGGVNDVVFALAVYDGDLIAGGRFTEAGGESANHIACWDGFGWHPMQTGMNDDVNALAVQDQSLIAAGRFTEANGQVAKRIARWDGSSWSPLGDGMGGRIWAVTPYGEDLLAGGSFIYAEGVVCNYVARWEGLAWRPMGSGLGPSIGTEASTMTVFDGSVFVGGEFTSAGEKPSYNVARWDDVAPQLALAVFQNPYLTWCLDVFAVASESLDSASIVLKVEQDSIGMRLIDSWENVWLGDYKLATSSDSVALTLCARDVIGNETCLTAYFSSALVSAKEGGTVTSPDRRLRLRIGPGLLSDDTYILVLPCGNHNVLNEDKRPAEGRTVCYLAPSESAIRAYHITPEGSLKSGEGYLEYKYRESDLEPGMKPDQLYIEQEGVGPLECVIDPEKQTVGARISRLGRFTLARGSPGSSQIRDSKVLRVEPIRPNPFFDRTTVQFEIRAPQRVTVTVYDVTGRKVLRLLDDLVYPGRQEIEWDGRGRLRRKAPSGVYFVVFETDYEIEARKVALIR